MDFKQFKDRYQKIEVEEISNIVDKNPKVSIIVQTYQHENYIEECLKGILAQKTDFPIEIIIGEDCSKDQTRKICLDYSAKFSDKIRLFLHHRENQIKILNEPSSNFNAIHNFFSARGEYIAFCEGDDIWSDPFKLQQQIDYLDTHKDYSFTYHSFQTIDAKSNPIFSVEENNQPRNDINSYELKICKYHPLLLTVCFRNRLNNIPDAMIKVLNLDSFLISLLGNIGEAKFLGQIKPSLYRKHSGGIWSNRILEKKNKSKILTYKNLTKYYKERNDLVTANFFKNLALNNYKSLLYVQFKENSYIKLSSTLYSYLKYRLV